MPRTRHALITGGNRGIGLETARQLAERGLRVTIGARSADLGEAAVSALQARGYRLASIVLYVADVASVAAAAEALSRAHAPVDVLINNAGVCPLGGVLDADPDRFEQALAVNFLGALHCCRAFVPGMLARAYGSVVNVSSGHGSFEHALSAAPAPYGLSKAALNALTLRLAAEVRGDVKVNAVDPGWVRTRMGGPGATRSVAEGARGIVWAATLPKDGPNGGFFRDGRPLAW